MNKKTGVSGRQRKKADVAIGVIEKAGVPPLEHPPSFAAVYSMELKNAKSDPRSLQNLANSKKVGRKDLKSEDQQPISKIQKTPKAREKKHSSSNSHLGAIAIKKSAQKASGVTPQEGGRERLQVAGKVVQKQLSEHQIPSNQSKDFIIKTSKLKEHRRDFKLRSVGQERTRGQSSSNSTVPIVGEEDPATKAGKYKRSSIVSNSSSVKIKSSSLPPSNSRKTRGVVQDVQASQEYNRWWDEGSRCAPNGKSGRTDSKQRQLQEESLDRPWMRNRFAESDQTPSRSLNGLGLGFFKPDDYQMDNLKHMIIEEADNMIEESDKENEFVEERDMLIKLKKKRKTNLLADLIPLNMNEEKQKFYSMNCKYSPQFLYSHEKISLKYKTPHSQFVKEAKSILDSVLKEFGSDEYFFAMQGNVVSRDTVGIHPLFRNILQSIRF